MAGKLLILDGTGIVRRVWEAIKDDDSAHRVKKTLEATWASMMRSLREHEPTHFLAAFDHGGVTWRHRLYEHYKADRAPFPQPLLEALPSLIEKLNHAGLCTLRMPDVEADDVMTSLGVKAAARGFEVVVATSDKDLLRLLDRGVKVYDHFKSQWRDEAWVLGRYGVPSRLMTDLLALWGDDEDGIPGVRGVADKTAAKLLGQFADVEGVIKAAQEMRIKGKVGQSILDSIDVIRLSFALAAMKEDLDLGVRPRDMQLPAHLIPAIHALPQSTLVRTSRTDEEAARRLSAHRHESGPHTTASSPAPATPPARRLRM